MAVSHSLLVSIYHVLSTKHPYSDLGADYFEQRDSARLTQRSVRQLEALGYTVTLVPKEVAKPSRVRILIFIGSEQIWPSNVECCPES